MARLHTLFFAAVFLPSVLFAETQELDTNVRIVGTDLLGVEFSKALHGFCGERQLRVSIALDGSRPAVAELKAGRADLGLVVLPSEEESLLTGLATVPVAFHRIVFLAPANCPVNEISLEQLAGVFGAGGATNIEHWQDLGCDGEWARSPVRPLAPAIGAGIAAEFFRHAVLHDRELKSNVERYRDFPALAHRFEGESRVIAIAADLPANAARIKILAVKPADHSPGFLPTAENLEAGLYPLGLPLRAAFRPESATRLAPLLHFLAGSESAAFLTRAGLSPLSPSARAQQLAALEKM